MGAEQFLDSEDEYVDGEVQHEDANDDEMNQRRRNEWHSIGSRVRERYIANLYHQ